MKGADSGSLDLFQIVKMDWLNDNVIGKIPGIDAFKEDARELLFCPGSGGGQNGGGRNTMKILIVADGVEGPLRLL